MTSMGLDCADCLLLRDKGSLRNLQNINELLRMQCKVGSINRDETAIISIAPASHGIRLLINHPSHVSLSVSKRRLRIHSARKNGATEKAPIR